MNEHLVATQSNEGEKISNDTLSIVQKAFSEVDKIINNKQNDDFEENLEPEVKAEEAEEAVEEEVPVEEETPVEEEVVEKVEKKKEKLLSKESKYRKLQNDKYRALAEKEEALRRAAELEKLLNQSINSGNYHYGKSIEATLEKAKYDKRMAISNGDADALVEADIAIAKAVGALSELERYAPVEQKNPYQDYDSHHNNRHQSNELERHGRQDYDVNHGIQQRSELKEEKARDWLDNHSYLQPDSTSYNTALAEQVSKYVNELDRSLQKNNQMDLYFSDDYFDAIDEYIEEIKPNYTKIIRPPIPNKHIGGVRHGHAPSVSGGGQTTQKVQLSAQEKLWCKEAGIPESSLVKTKIEMQAKGE
jgi:hypothetical protein